MSERSLPRRLDRAILTLLLLIAAAPAIACTARLGPVSAPPILYDPFMDGTATGSIRVGVDLVDGDACAVTLRLTDPAGAPLRSLSFGPMRRVVLLTRLTTIDGVRTATDDTEAAVTFAAGRRHIDVEWRLVGVEDDVLPPGDYEQPVQVQLGTAIPDASPTQGTVIMRSIPRAQINLAMTPGPFATGGDTATIDLGELRTGGTGRAFLQLRANTSANLVFTSRNRGQLRQLAGAAGVPYRLSIDGRDVPLTTPTSYPVASPGDRRGDVYELMVTVGDIAGAAAGRYTDTVTIDVSP